MTVAWDDCVKMNATSGQSAMYSFFIGVGNIEGCEFDEIEESYDNNIWKVGLDKFYLRFGFWS